MLLDTLHYSSLFFTNFQKQLFFSKPLVHIFQAKRIKKLLQKREVTFSDGVPAVVNINLAKAPQSHAEVL